MACCCCDGDSSSSFPSTGNPLLDKYNEQRPTAPTLFVSAPEDNTDLYGDVYVMYAKQLEFSIDCYGQTSKINMLGIWHNQTDMTMDAVFMIPTRGHVTDCFIHIGSNRLRTIKLANRGLVEEKEGDPDADVFININSDDNAESAPKPSLNGFDLNYLFSRQFPGYFRIPFEAIPPGQHVRVDLYYAESLRIQNHQLYLSIPMRFGMWTLPKNQKWNNIIKRVTATIHHPTNFVLNVCACPYSVH